VRTSIGNWQLPAERLNGFDPHCSPLLASLHEPACFAPRTTVHDEISIPCRLSYIFDIGWLFCSFRNCSPRTAIS
jgi:hypothetical protein